jgi:hypothetical protein
MHPRAKVVDGRNYNWKCIGLVAPYHAIKLAGLGGKVRTKEKLLKEIEEILQPENGS